MWRRLKAFNQVIDIANHINLKPKKAPDPHGVKWWNEECMAACALVYHAPTEVAHRQVFWELHHTIRKAKHSWVHNLLNSADATADIWQMSKV